MDSNTIEEDDFFNDNNTRYRDIAKSPIRPQEISQLIKVFYTMEPSLFKIRIYMALLSLKCLLGRTKDMKK